jgi:hypothetical protein
MPASVSMVYASATSLLDSARSFAGGSKNEETPIV